MSVTPARRYTDSGIGIIAASLKRLWDFIDERDIDKHIVSLFILWGTWKITDWSMGFAAALGAKPGIEVAAVIAAVTAPYMALQAAAIAFYFRSRSQ